MQWGPKFLLCAISFTAGWLVAMILLLVNEEQRQSVLAREYAITKTRMARPTGAATSMPLMARVGVAPVGIAPGQTVPAVAPLLYPAADNKVVKPSETQPVEKAGVAEAGSATNAAAVLAAKTTGNTDLRKLTVANVQTLLMIRGYDGGSVDGKMGPNTRNAIRAYQRANNLRVTGWIDAELAASLLDTAGKETRTAQRASTPETRTDRQPAQQRSNIQRAPAADAASVSRNADLAAMPIKLSREQ